MTECLYKRQKKERKHRDTERGRPCEDRGRDWSDVSIRTVSSHHVLGEKHRKDCLSEPPEGIKSAKNFDFGLLTSGTVREYFSTVLSHLAYGNLLWQHQEMNTVFDV